ncbi:type II toxin-antitoxin system MqsA family antitoxin [Halomonas cerina]|uniref:Putative zinc finger/helix-turn-helix YgiT family protein n=1 Tax=Halomonas cerina TaxID=447424 RepID=A0A839V9G0_9GAMM|nr:type II toxin-antitoxin system MqsA family antitoxin [Halomonas cerina]MBB3192092.1 putative zinc finger/helix-turn-helix YgiT family protein [Halomonas cerina]
MSKQCVICAAECGIIEVEEKFLHKGAYLSVPGIKYYKCSSCEEEFVDYALDKENSFLVNEKKKQAEGRRTAGEVFRLRKRFGISQADAAKVFGGGANAFSKYERGEVTQSAAMDKLMSVAEDIPGVMEYLCEKEGVEYSREVKKASKRGLASASPIEDLCAKFSAGSAMWGTSLRKVRKTYAEVSVVSALKVAESVDEDAKYRVFVYGVSSALNELSTPRIKELSSDEELYRCGFDSEPDAELEMRH